MGDKMYTSTVAMPQIAYEPRFCFACIDSEETVSSSDHQSYYTI